MVLGKATFLLWQKAYFQGRDVSFSFKGGYIFLQEFHEFCSHFWHSGLIQKNIAACTSVTSLKPPSKRSMALARACVKRPGHCLVGLGGRVNEGWVGLGWGWGSVGSNETGFSSSLLIFFRRRICDILVQQKQDFGNIGLEAPCRTGKKR